MLTKRLSKRKMVAIVLCAVLALVPWAAVSAGQAGATVYPNGGIHGSVIYNPAADRCVDVSNGSTAPGTKIQLWDCTGTYAQHWSYDTASGSLRAFNTNNCLDIAGGVQAPWTKVQLWPCNGTTAQRWTLGLAGQFMTTNGLCLDAYGGGTANGTQLQVNTCNGTGAQIFAGPSLPNGGSLLMNHTNLAPIFSRCIGLGGDESLPGGPLFNMLCDRTAGLQWKYAPLFSLLGVFNNECLDIAGGVQVPGNWVRLCPCNGGTSQRWTMKSNGTIVSTSGLCLGLRPLFNYVDLETCNGNSNQVWSLS
jgi:hypothetical protein